MPPIQKPSEILIYQGEKVTKTVSAVDAKGNAITLGALASMTFKAYKYLADTVATVTATGAIIDGGNDTIDIPFNAVDTANVTPGTYWYILEGTNAGNQTVFARSLIQVLRAT